MCLSFVLLHFWRIIVCLIWICSAYFKSYSSHLWIIGETKVLLCKTDSVTFENLQNRFSFMSIAGALLST
jgi:hypothetical protein